MPVSSPDRFSLSGGDRHQLHHLVRAGGTEQRLVMRARIVLLAGDRRPTAVIARKLGIHANTGIAPSTAMVEQVMTQEP